MVFWKRGEYEILDSWKYTNKIKISMRILYYIVGNKFIRLEACIYWIEQIEDLRLIYIKLSEKKTFLNFV